MSVLHHISIDNRILLNRFRTARRCYELKLQTQTDARILLAAVEALRYINTRIDALGGSPKAPRGLQPIGEVR